MMRQSDVQEAHSILECCALQTEQCCRASRTTNPPVCFPQSFQDRLALDSPKVETPGRFRRGLSSLGRLQFFKRHFEAIPRGKNHRPLDEVLQFPDISRPRPLGHGLQRRSRNFLDPCLHAAGVSGDEVLNENGYVFSSFA